MALKRRHKIDATFSMASMTDVIFLLLIFFMITSTIVFPNSIKVNLPQSNQQAAAKPLTRVTIDENELLHRFRKRSGTTCHIRPTGTEIGRNPATRYRAIRRSLCRRNSPLSRNRQNTQYSQRQPIKNGTGRQARTQPITLFRFSVEQQKKDKILALVTTIVLHIVVLFVLWLTFLGKEPVGTGSGVLVQVGFVDESAGMFESNADRPEQTETERPRENEDELLTQTDEESIHIEKKEEKKDKIIQENKKDERIANQVKNAFGKGVSNDGSRGDSDEGSSTQGNPFGNSSTGEITGVGGYGGYNLGGRGLVGSLPYPEYDNSNDAGIIAISITVDPQGKVISAIATVNGSKGTAFSNPKLRASAEAAARKSRFERSTGSSNQTGVIIYIFKQN